MIGSQFASSGSPKRLSTTTAKVQSSSPNSQGPFSESHTLLSKRTALHCTPVCEVPQETPFTSMSSPVSDAVGRAPSGAQLRFCLSGRSAVAAGTNYESRNRSFEVNGADLIGVGSYKTSKNTECHTKTLLRLSGCPGWTTPTRIRPFGFQTGHPDKEGPGTKTLLLL